MYQSARGRTRESHSSCLVFPLNRFYFLRRSYFGKDAQSGIILRGRVSLLLPRTERVPDESLSFATLKGKKVREETPLDKRGNCEKPREFREKERDKGNESAKHQKKSEIGTEREGDEETCRHLTQPRTAQGGEGGEAFLCALACSLSALRSVRHCMGPHESVSTELRWFSGNARELK